MPLSRRSFVVAAAAFAAAPTAACSAQPAKNDKAPAPQNPIASRPIAMAVHRDPGCPCCDEWAALARKAGYRVTVADDPDIAARKRRLGVPADLQSCHTTEVAGYVLEGHVPFDSLARLLASGDRTIVGLAVPGMPLGSPGMGAPSTAAAYQVIAFERSGKRHVFADISARG